MSFKKKILLISLVILILGFLYKCSRTSESSESSQIIVAKGTIKEKVIAVGNIVPKHTVSVKSNIPGIVGQLLHEEGDYVEQGALLLQVTPSPTPQSIAEAHASVKEHAATVLQAESHLERLQQLLKKAIITPDDYGIAVKDVSTNKARLEMAEQKLALLQKGEANIAGKNIKTMVNSPISGYILKRSVDLGDPVVPLTDSQEGTVLLVIANMQDLIFKGLVNEIDVGKISPGMQADVKVAALPDINITGKLRKVNLQANNDANSTGNNSNSPFNVGFNIELNELNFPSHIRLRAGLSATAEITVKEAQNVLIIPERVLIFKDNKVYVNIVQAAKNSTPELREIALGISDGINVEVTKGLKLNERILDNYSAKN